MSVQNGILFIILSYLWGSVPFGYLLTRFYTGKNILELGSGNVGSTNVKRIAGKKLSALTQILDMLKGFLPVALTLCFEPQFSSISFTDYYPYSIALAAILGHDFSIFLRFKGGKGVNTSLGASVLFAPYSVCFAVVAYFIVKWKFKYVSMGSIVLALLLPLSEFLLYGLSSAFYFLLVCSALIVVLHRANIIRLINGNELAS